MFDIITYTAAVNKAKEMSTGKSAYDYAKEGGYTGTEEEFIEKLANITSKQEIIDEVLAFFLTSEEVSV